MKIDRREFLKGAGFALALPWLESAVMAAPNRIKRLVCLGNRTHVTVLDAHVLVFY